VAIRRATITGLAVARRGRTNTFGRIGQIRGESMGAGDFSHEGGEGDTKWPHFPPATP